MNDHDRPPGGYKPRMTLYRTLILLWVGPSIGAAVVIFRNLPGREWTLNDWRTIPIEIWVAASILLLHLLFVIFFYRCRRNEVARPWPVEETE